MLTIVSSLPPSFPPSTVGRIGCFSLFVFCCRRSKRGSPAQEPRELRCRLGRYAEDGPGRAAVDELSKQRASLSRKGGDFQHHSRRHACLRFFTHVTDKISGPLVSPFFPLRFATICSSLVLVLDWLLQHHVVFVDARLLVQNERLTINVLRSAPSRRLSRFHLITPWLTS